MRGAVLIAAATFMVVFLVAGRVAWLAVGRHPARALTAGPLGRPSALAVITVFKRDCRDVADDRSGHENGGLAAQSRADVALERVLDALFAF
jgi:hypothetical protein